MLLQEKMQEFKNVFFVTTGIYENNDYTKEPLFYEVEHETVSSLAEVIL